jgi:RTA1 like protein
MEVIPSIMALTKAPYNYFGYNPNIAAAIIVCVAFGITFFIGLSNNIRHRKHIKGKFLRLFIFCPFAKMIGYALRAAACPRPTYFNLYIASQFFLFMTPQIMAAAGYLTYAGLVFYVDGKFSLIGYRNVAIIFLGMDVLATSIQGAGETSWRIFLI